MQTNEPEKFVFAMIHTLLLRGSSEDSQDGCSTSLEDDASTSKDPVKGSYSVLDVDARLKNVNIRDMDLFIQKYLNPFQYFPGNIFVQIVVIMFS